MREQASLRADPVTGDTRRPHWVSAAAGGFEVDAANTEAGLDS